jgi:hypothetical protein
MSDRPPPTTREERLAAQLRANLRRRKAQAKARDEAAEPPAPGSRPSQTR